MGQKVLHRNDGAFIGQALGDYNNAKSKEEEERKAFYQKTGMFPEDLSTDFADKFASEFTTPQQVAEAPTEDIGTKMAMPVQPQSSVPTMEQKSSIVDDGAVEPPPASYQGLTPNASGPAPMQTQTQPKVNPGYERFKQAEIQRRAEAEARLAEMRAKAKYYGGGTSGGDGGLPPISVVTDPATGLQFYQVPSGRGGYVKTAAIAPAPIAINPTTGEQVALPRGGKVVSPPGVADAMTLRNKLGDFRASLGELETLVNNTPSGRLAGNGAYYINKFTGLFPEVKTASSVGQLLVPMATRVLGGDVGNLSMTEQVAATQLMKLEGATVEERKQAFAVLKALTERKQVIANKMINENKMFNKAGLDETPEALAAVDQKYQQMGIKLNQVSANPDEAAWNKIREQYPNETDDQIDQRFVLQKKGVN